MLIWNKLVFKFGQFTVFFSLFWHFQVDWLPSGPSSMTNDQPTSWFIEKRKSQTNEADNNSPLSSSSALDRAARPSAVTFDLTSLPSSAISRDGLMGHQTHALAWVEWKFILLLLTKPENCFHFHGNVKWARSNFFSDKLLIKSSHYTEFIHQIEFSCVNSGKSIPSWMALCYKVIIIRIKKT